MDISSWPMERIMLLPDNLFGQRYLYGRQNGVSDDDTEGLTIEATLPERMVIWEVGVKAFIDRTVDAAVRGSVSFWLVAHRTAVPAQIRLGHVLFPYVSAEGDPNGSLAHDTVVRQLRMGVERRGQWLGIIMASGPAVAVQFKVWLVISSVPTWIPDGIGKLYE